MSETYHNRPEISNSQVKTYIKDGPATFYGKHLARAALDTKAIIDDEPTEAMLFGTDVHQLVLESSVFNETVILIPDEVLSKSGSRAGGAWKEFESANIGRRLVK